MSIRKSEMTMLCPYFDVIDVKDKDLNGCAQTSLVFNGA